ncbi:hypothetical protein [Kitasatospora sp. NPDC059327]|uniref:hypothetical protein n=1 Tax=Kitasatospora sp. NPDC059327 TaxID=3346803 RepID=UPI0036BE6C13
MTATRLRPPPYVLGRRWLAGASSDPRFIYGAWTRGRAALVPVSCRFDAIQVDDVSRTRAMVEELRTSERVTGPVLVDHGARTSYWLVPVRPDALWAMRDSELLTDRGDRPMVAMPAPGVGQVDGREWLVDPDGSGALTAHADLAVALRLARMAEGRRLRGREPARRTCGRPQPAETRKPRT